MLDYDAIVEQTEAASNKILMDEYTKVSTALETSVKEQAKKGYFSTMVTVKLALKNRVIDKLKIEYPKFSFEFTEPADRSSAIYIRCSWHPLGKYESD